VDEHLQTILLFSFSLSTVPFVEHLSISIVYPNFVFCSRGSCEAAEEEIDRQQNESSSND
jgi:hypothetical protein